MSTKFYSDVYARLNYNYTHRTTPINNKCYNANSPNNFDISQMQDSYRTWYQQQMGLNENNMYQDAYTTQLDTPVPTDPNYMSYDSMPQQYGSINDFCNQYKAQKTQTEAPTYGMSTKMRIGTMLMNSSRLPKVTTFY